MLPYYQQELLRLQELGREFADAHPAVAPMLSGSSADPDVERLLEGVAFLTGNLREKLDDEFPEILHGLLRLVFPHYLRPIPSTTILQFLPKPSSVAPIAVARGVEIASVPIEGTPCIFRTTLPVTVYPLTLTNARYDVPAARAPSIRLSFTLRGMDLDSFDASSLRLHLAGDYANASYLYYLLQRHLRRIVLEPGGGGMSTALPAGSLRGIGFDRDESLFPYPGQSYPGYRLLQEYFTLPEKFLFLDVTGLSSWRNRGGATTFDLVFELDGIPDPAPKIRPDHFALFATPAINLSRRWTDPIRLDHRLHEYRVIPDSRHPTHFQIYSVERVMGLAKGSSREREYEPIERFAWRRRPVPQYHITQRPSPVTQEPEHSLSVMYPEGMVDVPEEVLSIEVMCTNASLPEKLNLGDISQPTSTSPEGLSFRNIRLPTASVNPPLGGTLLWRLLSHLGVNHLPLDREENLRHLLQLYVFPDNRDKATVHANRMRVDSLRSVRAAPANRIVAGCMMRGQSIDLEMDGDGFNGQGDLYLFGDVLDHFLGGYASTNSFTHLRLKNLRDGNTYAWAARVGDRSLL